MQGIPILLPLCRTKGQLGQFVRENGEAVRKLGQKQTARGTVQLEVCLLDLQSLWVQRLTKHRGHLHVTLKRTPCKLLRMSANFQILLLLSRVACIAHLSQFEGSVAIQIHQHL